MIILTYYLTQSIGSRGEVTLGERVQLGEAAFVEPPTKTDARDTQHEAGPTGPEVVLPPKPARSV